MQERWAGMQGRPKSKWRLSTGCSLSSPSAGRPELTARAVIRSPVEGRELGPEMAFDKLRVRFCQRALPGQALASPDGRLFVRSKAVDLDDEPVAQRRGLIGRQRRLR
jgi:hypothetical protein